MAIRLTLLAVVFLLLPLALFAQELRIAESTPVEIDDPEAYRAYYGKLEGQPDVYRIQAAEPFRLSVVILTPDVDGARTDFSARIVDTAAPDEPFASVDGTTSEWVAFFDTSGRDDYLAGPLFQAGAPAGSYEIEVSNADNQGAYVLLLGEESAFSFGEILHRYSALPAIKSDFFGKPAYQAFLAPLLLWPVLALLIVLAIIVFGIYVLRSRRAPGA
jgi:hypothetical protein